MPAKASRKRKVAGLVKLMMWIALASVPLLLLLREERRRPPPVAVAATANAHD